MKRRIPITESYLYIPVCTGHDLKNLSFYLEEDGEKILELRVPVDMSKEEEYAGSFMAEIPVRQFAGKTIIVEGDFPLIMGMTMENGPKRTQYVSNRPRIHFTANRGWTNDPNGMVYKDGLYHLYFQYNPFDIQWENMCWGHAVSRDLLHWAQLDTVLFPDEDGTMFSGCGLVNDHGLMGLPEDALLFYYTVAGGSSDWSKGKEFTQKIAYSTDMGETLTKIKEPCIDTLYYDNRDPKIFWHEESKAYIMVLWLKGNDFGIFRSTDLKSWELSQEIHLEEAWECPDLFCLTSPEGEKKWFFWSADGYYYPGNFDGWRFEQDGIRHTAYMSKLAYAAQTFSNVSDRVISIPWLRLENDGRLFTSSYGIPTEMSYVPQDTPEGGTDYLLVQKPVREFYERLEPADPDRISKQDDKLIYENRDHDKAFALSMELAEDYGNVYRWEINDSVILYSPQSGWVRVDEERYQAGLGYRKVFMIVDDRILEIFFDDGIRMGTFALKGREISFAMDESMAEKVEMFEVE
ncbi:MAG: glycoside hydrolase family 32 protein [Eubacterium sp.]|nr:glycoside hydrolase family 32 protein [Eubacterium sp.]